MGKMMTEESEFTPFRSSYFSPPVRHRKFKNIMYGAIGTMLFLQVLQYGLGIYLYIVASQSIRDEFTQLHSIYKKTETTIENWQQMYLDLEAEITKWDQLYVEIHNDTKRWKSVTDRLEKDLEFIDSLKLSI